MKKDKSNTEKQDTKKQEGEKKERSKKSRRNANVLAGERDEDGKLKTPHTKYGLASNISFIFKKIWQYRKILLLYIIIGAFTQSILRFIWSFIVKYIIDIVQVQAGKLQVDIQPLFQFLILVAVIEIIVLSTNTFINNRVWFNFIGVRLKLMTERTDKVLSMDYQILEQPQMLDLVQKANNATGGNHNGVEGMMQNIFRMSALMITMIVSATAIIGLDWILILALTVAMLTNYGSYLWSVKCDKLYYWDKMAPNWRKMNYMERCTQDFDYAKDIRIFSMKNLLLSKQKEVFRDYERKFMRSRNFWLRHSFIYTFTSLFSGSVMYYILVTQVLQESISIGNFTLFLGLCDAFSSALSDFYSSFGSLQYCSLQTDDYRTFMDYPTDESKDYHDLHDLMAKGIFNFEFKNVSYRYEGAEDYTLKNLNLSFPAKQRLAVVGLNGAGKTTFIKLLLRLYDVTEGEILLNGINIKEFRRDEYYTLFSPVFQNVELFAFPMAENISMKSPEKTDKNRASQCISKVGMKDKMESLDKGIDTEILKIIYEDGIDLSGGEKQKLALARALYKGAPVIVLDEPTAALDPLAEYELYQKFDQIISNKSAIYISHRLSSTRFCDAIAMFDSGELVEYGSHEELLKKGGAYAKMFEVQAQYYEVQNEAV